MKKILSLFLILVFMLSFTNTIFADTLPEDYAIPIAKISMYPDLQVTTQTPVTFSSATSVTYNNSIVEEQWENKQEYYPAGLNTVRLRVRDDLNNWSQWTEMTFVVLGSSTGEDYDYQPPVAKITMYPDLVIRENDIVTFSSANSTVGPGKTIINEEWENKREQYTVGVHTVRLRVQDSDHVWSQWTELTFTVIGRNTITTEKPDNGPVRLYSITEATSINNKIDINDSLSYDLTNLSFLLRYTDDSTRTVSVYDTEVSIDSRYRNSAKITGAKKLLFYDDAEYTTISVTFSYYEDGVTVYTTVDFEYDITKYYGKVTNFRTNQTEIEISRDEIFYFDALDFTVLFDSGKKENFTGSDVNFSLPAQYSNLVYLDADANNESKKLMPTEKAKIGDKFFLIFYVYEDDYDATLELENPAQYTAIVSFTITAGEADDQYADLMAITPLDPVISLKKNEVLDINSLSFLAHMKTGQRKTLYANSFQVYMQYEHKKYVEYNEADKTVKFTDNTPYGTKVQIDFAYINKSTAKTSSVILVYTKGEEANVPGKLPIFTDISGHWAQSDIISMSLKNMLVGHTNTKFFPDQYTTREEVAGFIYKYLELDTYDFDEEIDLSMFTDISKYNQSREYIARVHEVGILQGYEDGTFRPTSNITREELATVLFRTYQYKTGTALVGSNASRFGDDKNIASWAYDYVYSAKALKILEGRTDGNFWPKDNTTRAEITAILNRMLK